MKKYTIADKTTLYIIGIIDLTPEQLLKIESDFIVKEA